MTPTGPTLAGQGPQAPGPAGPEASSEDHLQSDALLGNNPVWRTADSLRVHCEEGLSRFTAGLNDPALDQELSGVALVERYDREHRQLVQLSLLGRALAHVLPDEAQRSAAADCEDRAGAAIARLERNPGWHRRLRQVDAEKLDDEAKLVLQRFLELMQDDGLSQAQIKQIQRLRWRNAKVSQAFMQTISGPPSMLRLSNEQIAALNLPPPIRRQLRLDERGRTKVPAIPFITQGVLSASPDRGLRRRFWVAQNRHGFPENQARLLELIANRHNIAKLRGHSSWYRYQAKSMMIGDRRSLVSMLGVSHRRALEQLKPTLDAALALARQHEPGLARLAPWDLDYWLRRLESQTLQVLPRNLPDYTPFAQVVDRVFNSVGGLFGLTVTPLPNAPGWAPGVLAYEVTQTQGASWRLYLDPRERHGKIAVPACMQLRVPTQENQHGVALMMFHFPELLTTEGSLDPAAVSSFMHEFGHFVEHALVQPGRLHLDNEPRQHDFSEVVSVFFEKLLWDRRVFDLVFRHPIHGTPLAEAAFQSLKQKSQDLPNLELLHWGLPNGFFAMQIHDQGVLSSEDLASYRREAYENYGLHPVVPGTHPELSVIHLTGYNSGVYTYALSDHIARTMAEELAAHPDDLQGVLTRLRREVLNPGSSVAPRVRLTRFLGRVPPALQSDPNPQL